MSTRGFLILMAAWAVVLWLATTPLGAMLGFFVAISAAWFLVPMALMSRIPEAALVPVGWGLAGLYAGFVLFCAVRGIVSWLRGQHDSARGWWASAISLGAVPLMLWWSVEALERAWV